MCIIMYATKKQGLPTETLLRSNFKSNSDGGGYAITFTDHKGRKKVEFMKGYMDFEPYYSAVKTAYDKLTADDDYIVMHMRIATSGGATKDKTHPFLSKKGYLIFQNGICPSAITKQLKEKESDTEWVAKNYQGIDWLKKLDDVSRWVIIDPKGNIDFLGTWVTDDDGRKWSNSGFRGWSNYYHYPRNTTSYYDYGYNSTSRKESVMLAMYKAKDNGYHTILEYLVNNFNPEYNDKSDTLVFDYNKHITISRKVGKMLANRGFILGTGITPMLIMKPKAVLYPIEDMKDGGYMFGFGSYGLFLKNALPKHMMDYVVIKDESTRGDYPINVDGRATNFYVISNKDTVDAVVKAVNDYLIKMKVDNLYKMTKHRRSVGIYTNSVKTVSPTVCFHNLSSAYITSLKDEVWDEIGSMDCPINISSGYISCDTMVLILWVSFNNQASKRITIDVHNAEEDKNFGIPLIDIVDKIVGEYLSTLESPTGYLTAKEA